jgi:hypothetical protein
MANRYVTGDRPEICISDGCNNKTTITSSYGRPKYNSRCRKCKDNLSKYKMTTPERDKLLETQNNECKICKHTISFTGVVGVNGDSAVVDHCHNTGKVRGILCNTCNVGLGKFKDDKVLLEKAMKYIENSAGT